MEKIFSNKKFAYIVIGILIALQLTQSIANWCGGGFNGGSLILCILMLGLLTLVGVGIGKNNKLLTIVSGVAILSVVIYILAVSYSGLIQDWIDGKMPNASLIRNIFASVATLLLIGSFVLVMLKALGINKHLQTINTIFTLIAFVLFLVSIIIPLVSGYVTTSRVDDCTKIYNFARDFFALFVVILVPCVWKQLDKKE